MAVLLIITALFVIPFCAQSTPQKSYWRLSSDAVVTFSLSSCNENWDKMESGAFLWNAHVKALAAKQLSERVHNENTLKLAFGQMKFADRDSKKWSAAEKSTDIIDLETLMKLKTQNFSADPFLSLRAVSRFYDTRDVYNCRYVNPVTFTKSLGAAKHLIKQPNINWQMRMGGALRLSIDRDTISWEYIDGIYQSGKRETAVITDAGTEIISEFKIKRPDAASISGKLTIFEALVRPSHLQTQNWRYPDVSFETAISVNITKHLIFNYLMKLAYDGETDSGPAIKQTLSAGLSLSLENEHFKKNRRK